MGRELPSVVTAGERELGELRRRLASGELTRVRRGGYVVGSLADPGDPGAGAAAAVAHIAVVHRQLRAPHVFSHGSAALMWELPVWTVPTAAHVRQASNMSGRRSRDIARHAGLPRSHALIEGIPVTSLEQTVLDCLVTLPALDGLVVADAALRRGVRAGDVGELLAGLTQRRGTRRAALVLSLADAGAASAWESWLRYLAHHAGLPRPVTQWPIRTYAGRFEADLAWPEHRVLAEFDGAVKYTDGAFGADYSGRRALVDEKRREDAIAETLGVRPVRFMAADARRPEEAVRRLLSRFPRTLTSSLRTHPHLPLPLAPGPSVGPCA